MANLKTIRKRIASVKSTQKITRAMKMVAGARLNRAQQRITELRPYAVKTAQVLAEVTREEYEELEQDPDLPNAHEPAHRLLVARPERRVLLLVLTSDRGLCGAFNSNINKRAEREWMERGEAGQETQIVVIGRKGRDYMNRRNAPVLKYIPGIWDKLGIETAGAVTSEILPHFERGEVDAIYLVYNEFKSAMSQRVVVERLLPVKPAAEPESEEIRPAGFQFEPDKTALLRQLVPMYLEISILRALYESMASELGARMTAMDSATKNAKEMVDALTLQYNRARQAAITKELMEIIGGSEALKE